MRKELWARARKTGSASRSCIPNSYREGSGQMPWRLAGQSGRERSGWGAAVGADFGLRMKDVAETFLVTGQAQGELLIAASSEFKSCAQREIAKSGFRGSGRVGPAGLFFGAETLVKLNHNGDPSQG